MPRIEDDSGSGTAQERHDPDTISGLFLRACGKMLMTPSPNPDPVLVRESSCPDRGWKEFSDEEATQYRADRGPASAG
jgi:hypothetical protein